MNGDTMDSDDSDLDHDLDVSIPLNSITFLSCRDAMQDNGRLQLLVDQKDAKIKTLEFKANMTSPGEVMLRNIITAKSKLPNYPLDRLQTVVAEFLSTCQTNASPLETKRVCDSMHFLHEFERGETLIFPFMKFEVFGMQFVLSAYLSNFSIKMWWFQSDDYQAAMQYARSKRVLGYEIRDTTISGAKKTIIDNVWRTLNLQELSMSNPNPHKDFGENMYKDFGENMYRSAAAIFVDDFKKVYYTGEDAAMSAARSRCPVSVLDLNPGGIDLGRGEEDTFSYETNTQIRPFVLKAKGLPWYS